MKDYNFPPNGRSKMAHVEEVVAFKLLKQSGLLVKVRYDGGRLSTWLHSKDFPVHLLWQGGTSALYRVYG